jgi:flagellar hook-basal body complex protein FliE
MMPKMNRSNGPEVIDLSSSEEEEERPVVKGKESFSTVIEPVIDNLDNTQIKASTSTHSRNNKASSILQKVLSKRKKVEDKSPTPSISSNDVFVEVVQKVRESEKIKIGKDIPDKSSVQFSLETDTDTLGQLGRKNVDIRVLLKAHAARKAAEITKVKTPASSETRTSSSEIKNETSRSETQEDRQRNYSNTLSPKKPCSSLVKNEVKGETRNEPQKVPNLIRMRSRPGPASKTRVSCQPKQKEKDDLGQTCSDLSSVSMSVRPKRGVRVESPSKSRRDISVDLANMKKGLFLSSYTQLEEDVKPKREERSLPSTAPSERASLSPPRQVCSPGNYVVNRIKDMIIDKKGQLMFRVEWKDYPGEDTMEPPDDITNTLPYWRFEELFTSAYNLKDNRKSGELLLQFKSLLNELLEEYSRSESVNHSIALMMKLMGMKLEFFDSILKKDINALKNKVKTRFKLFLDYIPRDDCEEDSHDSNKSDSTRMKDTTYHALLLKLIKCSDLKSEVLDFLEDRKRSQSNNKLFLNRMQQEMNSAKTNVILMAVENLIDTAYLEKDSFEFLNSSVVHPSSKLQIKNPDQAFVPCNDFCSCCNEYLETGMAFEEEPCPCVLQNDSPNQEEKRFIYECSSICPCIINNKCSVSLAMRTLTSGHQGTKVSIFRTSTKEWALRTENDIPAKAFVMSVVGEFSLFKEFMSRTNVDNGNDSRVICLDYHPDLDPSKVTILDYTKRGNLSRFIRHSCNPNLKFNVFFSGSYDPYMPFIGLFSLEKIDKFSELTVDFNCFTSNTSKADVLRELSGEMDDDLLAMNGGLAYHEASSSVRLKKCFCFDRPVISQSSNNNSDGKNDPFKCKVVVSDNVDYGGRVWHPMNPNYCQLYS